MTFKSPTQPLCRYCGKPIAKRTESVTVWGAEPPRSYVDRHGNTIPIAVGPYVIGTPSSIADCRKLTNLAVVSVVVATPSPGRPKRIERFSVWDGETYVDQYFDKGSCAQAFGYLAAREGR